MIIEAAGVSDIGRVRPTNQDRFRIFLEEAIFLVADGMSTPKGGEIAAELAAEWLRPSLKNYLQNIEKITDKNVFDALLTTIASINHKVLNYSKEENTDTEGMGTTLTTAFAYNNSVFLAHVGDSRAYLYRAEKLLLLTEDHSLIDLMIKRGEITEEEATTHPSRRALSRYIGMADLITPDLHKIEFSVGDRLLLCSDGLIKELSDRVISEIVSKQASALETCEELVSRANQQGGQDNITVVVIDHH
ncbi:MAG: Stp1/IreP family PP2C-type Ser/Thr phosphatase [Blastocatellia bacterium]|nr:Stp1/IreP family PP2C-type Ser/Thr phosphatase [Blastocatellia bacterium]